MKKKTNNANARGSSSGSGGHAGSDSAADADGKGAITNSRAIRRDWMRLVEEISDYESDYDDDQFAHDVAGEDGAVVAGE